MLGTYALSSGYYEAYYGRAQKVRTKIADDFREAFEKVDLIVTPTSPTVAFKLGERTEDPLADVPVRRLHGADAAGGHPRHLDPGGLADGLPVGIQLAGPAFSENRILDAAFALEQAIGFEGGRGAMRDPDRAYEPVIGLEIHVQLSTRTKMFCGCALSFGEEPNTRTCPVCLGHPGVLPVINAEAVHFALMIGMALECEIAERSIFHRKQYFYPDNPKAYQISQYDIPICGAGRLGDVRIHRAHLEEDAAKLVHAGASGRIHSAESSVVDFNRCGTPLVEIVTEPDLHDPKEAGEWLRLLRATLKRLGVSDVNMDEGSLRCDANVSLRHAGSATLGTKTELKNMNSFRFLERGIEAELKRQEEILRAGGEVEQETLHFDPQSGALSTLRSKEEAHDYRYFPEPDLVPVAPTEEMLERARAALPELPAARAERFESRARAARGHREAAGVPLASSATSTRRRSLGRRHRSADARQLGDAGERGRRRRAGGARRSSSRWSARRRSRPRPRARCWACWHPRAATPPRSSSSRASGPQGADELGDIVDRAIADNADAVEKIKAGKAQAIGAIVGAVMRETRGRADGGEVQKLIQEKLGL